MDFQQELIAEFDRETASTCKILAAIPADADFTYKPHPKSMSLGRLAGHTAELVGGWGLSILTSDKLEVSPEHKPAPYVPASTAAVLEQFDRDAAKLKAVLIGIPPQKWDEHWKFVVGGRVIMDLSRYQAYRICVMSHTIHHRAQLGVYLRLLNKPLPGTYGPSADDK
jgi:uncharacterized damage-inducible protein DinB